MRPIPIGFKILFWVMIVLTVSLLVSLAFSGFSTPSASQGKLGTNLGVVAASIGIPVGMVVVAIVAGRYFLRRRYAARPGGVPQMVVALSMFVSTLFAGLVMLLAGLQVWATAPFVGAAISIAGGIYIAVFLLYWLRLYRPSASASTTEPVVLSMSPMRAIWLIGYAFAVILLWTVK